MADETDVFAAKGSVFGSTIADRLKNSNVSQIDDKIITVVNGKLKWNEDFESLKYFIKTTLNLTGKWSSPGGHLKLFDEDSGRLIVRFYTNSTSLLFQGDEGKTLNDRRLTTGYYFKFEGDCGAISWEVKKLATVALSSAEAEYQAMAAAVQDAIYLGALMKDFGYPMKEPTDIGEDNQSCVSRCVIIQ
jgi:hypothetical protein